MTSTPPKILPPKLKPGDAVALVSPSSTVIHEKEDVERARQNFEAKTGLKTVLSPHALGQHYYTSGTQQERLDDLHWAFANPDMKGVIFTVGGYGAVDLVDELDYELIKNNPKVVAGISDATTLLNPIQSQTGLVTFLGIEFRTHGKQEMAYEHEYIQRAWFDGEVGEVRPNPNWQDFKGNQTSYGGWQTIRPGVAEGHIIGGNYGSFRQIFPTKYRQDIDGGILFLETYKFDKYKFAQAMSQLRLWGVFDKINGLVIGYCLGSDEPVRLGPDRPIRDILLEVAADFDFPIMQVGEVGHQVENIMLPLGGVARIDAGALTLEIPGPVAV